MSTKQRKQILKKRGPAQCTLYTTDVVMLGIQDYSDCGGDANRVCIIYARACINRIRCVAVYSVAIRLPNVCSKGNDRDIRLPSKRDFPH